MRGRKVEIDSVRLVGGPYDGAGGKLLSAMQNAPVEARIRPAVGGPHGLLITRSGDGVLYTLRVVIGMEATYYAARMPIHLPHAELSVCS